MSVVETKNRWSKYDEVIKKKIQEVKTKGKTNYAFLHKYRVGKDNRVKEKVVFDNVKIVLGKIPKLNYMSAVPFIPRKGVFLFGFVFGRTGMGKSTWLKMIALQAMNYGWGMFVIDPHGSLMHDVISIIPRHRIDDLVVIDPLSLLKYKKIVPFDPLYFDDYSQAVRVKEDIANLFDTVFGTRVGKRMSKTASMLAEVLVESAMEREKSKVCLQDAYNFLVDESRRNELLRYVWRDDVRQFFSEEEMTGGFGAVSYDALVSRLTPLVDSIIAPLFKYSPHAVSPSKVVNDGLILAVNLAKGEIKEGASNLLQNIITKTLFSASLDTRRLDGRVVPFLYLVDEAHSYDLSVFEKVFSEGRKYVVSAILTTQYPGQYDPATLEFIMQNYWFGLSFNLTFFSGLQKVFGERVDELSSLPSYHFMIRHKWIESGGEMSDVDPYVLQTVPLPRVWNEDMILKIIQKSLDNWGVEEEVFKEVNVADVKGRVRDMVEAIYRALGRKFKDDEAIEVIKKKFDLSYQSARRWFSLLVTEGLVKCDVTECVIPVFLEVYLGGGEGQVKEGVEEGEEEEVVEEEIIEEQVVDADKVLSREPVPKIDKKLVPSRISEKPKFETMDLINEVIKIDKFKKAEDIPNDKLEDVLRRLIFPLGQIIEEGDKNKRVYFYVDVKYLLEKSKKLPKELKDAYKSMFGDYKIQIVRAKDIVENNVDPKAIAYIFLEGDMPLRRTDLDINRTYVIWFDDVINGFRITLASDYSRLK